MFCGLKTQLYPTPVQQERMRSFCDASRWVYNKMLEWQIVRRRLDVGKESLFESYNWIPRWRTKHTWLEKVPVNVQRHALTNLDDAYEKFFERVKKRKGKAKGKLGFPKFKKKGKCKDAFTSSQNCKVKGQSVHIEGLGWVKASIYKPVGQVRRVTVHLHPNGNVYASLLCSRDVEVKPVPTVVEPARVIGLDVGLKSFVVSNKGAAVGPVRCLRDNLGKLARLQRRVSHSQKGSRRYARRQRKVAECHRSISATREYIHHLTAFRVTTGQMRHENQVPPHALVVEKLGVKGLLLNPRLARAIADAGWYQFRTVLKHHANKRGVHVIEVSPKGTSRECSVCHKEKEDLTLSIRSWTCPHCQTKHDRDVNASRNVRQRGLGVIKERGLLAPPRRENPSTPAD